VPQRGQKLRSAPGVPSKDLGVPDLSVNWSALNAAHDTIGAPAEARQESQWQIA